MKSALLAFAALFIVFQPLSLTAQEQFAFKDKVLFNYTTIQGLKRHAEEYLQLLDAQIAEKKTASESRFNPFAEQARKIMEELKNKRKDFLDSTWKCPHWKRCDNCDGGNKTWWVGAGWLGGPCWKCGGNNGFRFHGPHPQADTTQACPDYMGLRPATIRALLGNLG